MSFGKAWRRVLQIGVVMALALAFSAGVALADTTYSISGHVGHTAGDWDHAAISAVPYQYKYIVLSVDAFGAPTYGWVWQSVDISASTVATDGSYEIDSLAPGTYRVGFNDANLVYQTAFYQDKTAVASANDINVATSTTPGSVSSIDQTLTANPDREISGHVGFVGGTQVSGDVNAEIFSLNASGTWDVVYNTPVQDDGTYLQHVDSAGTYRVGFTDAGGLYPDVFYNGAAVASTVESATDVPVVDGTPAAAVNGTMTASPSVRIGATATDTVSTAIEISQAHFDDGIGGPVIICTADNWPDSLASTPLAHALNCPILLVHKNRVDPAVIDELNRLDAENVIIVGGTASVSLNDEFALRAAGFPIVRRLAGADRYGTSVAIAQEMLNQGLALFDENGALMKVAAATGASFNDALVGAPAAADQQMPLLLVQKTKVPTVVATFLAANETSATQVVVFGGPNSVASGAIHGLVPAGGTADSNVNQVGDSDAFRTSVAIADYELGSLGWPDRVVMLASNKDYADAVAMGPQLAFAQEPLLLTAPALTTPKKVQGSPAPYGYTQLTPATEAYISKQTAPSIDPAAVGYTSLDDTSTELRNFNIGRIDALGKASTTGNLADATWAYAKTVAGIH